MTVLRVQHPRERASFATYMTLTRMLIRACVHWEL
jgi:hypothetical protein